LLIVPLDMQITATNGNDKSRAGFHFARFPVLVQNVGNNSICTHLTATLESDLRVGRRDGTWTLKTNGREEITKGPDIHQLLPGETLNGSVVFDDLRNGVEPLTLIVASEGQTCAMKSPPPTGNPLLFHITQSENKRKISLVFLGNEYVNEDVTTANGGAVEGANVKSNAPGTADNNQRGNVGGAYRVGGGVSAPRALYAPDPEYSDEARKAGVSGMVVLWMVVDANGRPQQIRVQRALGNGLDEKAIEAVRQWKFDPARKDGQAVPVMINVEVNFKLYGSPTQPQKTEKPQTEPRRASEREASAPHTETPSVHFPSYIDRMKYPLEVTVQSSQTQYGATQNTVEMAIQIFDGYQRRGYTIGCSTYGGTCRLLTAGTYPARWAKSGRLEVISWQFGNQKMQKTAYVITREKCETPFTCK
jgi:TonB family protein